MCVVTIGSYALLPACATGSMGLERGRPIWNRGLMVICEEEPGSRDGTSWAWNSDSLTWLSAQFG